MKESFIVNEHEIQDIADKVIMTLSAQKGERAKVIFLHGELGAGKTTFTKELASLLGIHKDTVHSPTFILKKEYKTQHEFFKKLIHVDAYRFENQSEGKVLLLDRDMVDPSTLIAIEWPSKMSHNNPDMEITFTVQDDEHRKIEISV